MVSDTNHSEINIFGTTEQWILESPGTTGSGLKKKFSGKWPSERSAEWILAIFPLLPLLIGHQVSLNIYVYL